MQRLLEGLARELPGLVNDYLQKGWRVVPGTVAFHSHEDVASRDYAMQLPTTPRGTIFTLRMAVVIEKKD